MKFSLSWDKLLGACFYFFVFAIPFGTRKLLFQFTEGFHEYEAAFLYLTDLILAALFFFILFNYFLKRSAIISNFCPFGTSPVGRQFPISKLNIWLSIFLLSAAISIFFAVSKGLAVYQFIRLLVLAGLALITASLLRDGIVNLRGIFITLVASSIFQAIAGLMQFIKQGSIGLYFLGEPFLNADTAGVAKIAVEGVRYLRAYGTLPHPNVLGGFLVIGLISISALWLQYFTLLIHNNVKTTKWYAKYTKNALLVLGIAIIILGLILTFSRVAWLTAALSMLALTLRGFINKELRPRALALLFIFSASVALVIAPIRSLVFTRAEISVGEPAVTARLFYNHLALEIIKDEPWGVGLGNQVLYSVKNGLYQKLGMDKVWQWQPTHNLYLLIAAELGWVGLLSFVVLMCSLIFNFQFSIFKTHSHSEGETRSILLIALSALLALGLFDHYLWTLQPGRLILWLVLGMVMGLPAGRHGLTNSNTKYYNQKHENNN